MGNDHKKQFQLLGLYTKLKLEYEAIENKEEKDSFFRLYLLRVIKEWTKATYSKQLLETHLTKRGTKDVKTLENWIEDMTNDYFDENDYFEATC